MRLSGYKVVAFAQIVDVKRAKEFYRDRLGLTLLSEEPPFALVFDANGTVIRLGMAKQLPPATATALGWEVPDIQAAVLELEGAGVAFERYGPGRAGDLYLPDGR